jgi:hypothetical protein
MIKAEIVVPTDGELTPLERTIRTEHEIKRILESLGAAILAQVLQTGDIHIAGTQTSGVTDGAFVYTFEFALTPAQFELPIECPDSPCDPDDEKIENRGEVFAEGMQAQQDGLYLLTNPFRLMTADKTERELAWAWRSGWIVADDLQYNAQNNYGPAGQAQFDWGTFESWSQELRAFRLGYVKGYEMAEGDRYTPSILNPYNDDFQEYREMGLIWTLGFNKGWNARKLQRG